jgi:hypothetical protein
MKGHTDWSGVEMSAFIAAVVYGAFALGYVAMLMLTERTAGRYVRGEISQRHASTAVVAITPTRPVAGITPAFGRLATPAA